MIRLFHSYVGLAERTWKILHINALAVLRHIACGYVRAALSQHLDLVLISDTCARFL